MEYGIVHLSVIPVRASADDRSEMTTQLLFGELLSIERREKQWCHIQCAHDNYTGWIDEKQFIPLNEKEFKKHEEKSTAMVFDLVQSAISADHHYALIMGSSLPYYDGLNFRLLKERFVYNGQAIDPINNDYPIEVVEKCARKYLNAPYLWGGRSPFGIDCSGLTQMVFKMAGVKLRRDAYQQSEQGQTVNFVEESRIGDLAFFANKEGRINHVGILTGDGKIIHASGKVRMDKFDHYGIYNENKKAYTHKLRLIKRYI